MAAEPRTDEQIRSEIAAEREQLAAALDDLRAGVRSKRRLATLAASLVAALFAVLASLRVRRRLRGD